RSTRARREVGLPPGAFRSSPDRGCGRRRTAQRRWRPAARRWRSPEVLLWIFAPFLLVLAQLALPGLGWIELAPARGRALQSVLNPKEAAIDSGGGLAHQRFIDATDDGDPTSAGTAIAAPILSMISLAAPASGMGLRETRATRAASRASRIAARRPIPRPA